MLDKAIARRFPLKLEMPLLTGKELKHLFSILFPKRTDDQKELMETMTDISDDLIAQAKMEDARISITIPPR